MFKGTQKSQFYFSSGQNWSGVQYPLKKNQIQNRTNTEGLNNIDHVDPAYRTPNIRDHKVIFKVCICRCLQSSHHNGARCTAIE